MSTSFSKPQQQAKQKIKANAQVLESYRGLADGALGSFTHDLLKETPKDFVRQIMGPGVFGEKRVNGELIPGETLEIQEAISGEHEKRKELEKQLANERRIRQEEQALSSRKTQELRMQLSVLMQEVSQLSHTTQGLTKEVEVAAMQAPVNPGIYHVVFFETLVNFIRSFRKKIEDASVWLASYNTKAKKRAHTFWGQVGVSGAKRLLSSEDYAQRAAA